ncbi:hypothetical protein [Pseudocolwellia sp. HL-MZ7]
MNQSNCFTRYSNGTHSLKSSRAFCSFSLVSIMDQTELFPYFYPVGY